MEQAIEQSLRISPKKAADLQREFGISQPTLNRNLAKLEKAGRILRIGAARSTQYAEIRSLPLLKQSKVPIYEIAENGEARRAATLIPIYPNRFAVTLESKRSRSDFPLKSEIFPSLPYYLQTMRPEGFLGRMIAAQAHGSFGLPKDPRNWAEEDVLFYAAVSGDNLPGAFVLGEESISRFLEDAPDITHSPEAEIFAHEAEKAEAGQPVGSSAGGEQPKFTILARNSGGTAHHMIVKFSGVGQNAASRRWRDLLICEHSALEVLRKFGLPASNTRIASHHGRTYLVVERSDRVGMKGRLHYCPLGALDDAYHGDRSDIRKSAHFFLINRFITASDFESIVLISLFGDFIGNTDQHFGNTSFMWKEGHFTMAPAYDVLPMWYAPRSQGTLPAGLHPMPIILPDYYKYKARLREMISSFWQAVQNHPEMSEDFLAIAGQNLERKI